MIAWFVRFLLGLMALTSILMGGLCQLSHDRDELLNWCMDGMYHKSKAGPEDSLHGECQPWKDWSCCNQNVTRDAHMSQMYNFTWNHCGHVRNMSLECRQHFIQDLCFYECEPNLGPWMVKVDMKIRKERFYKVPLCQSDCSAWFESCRREYTCVDNWVTKFNWQDGRNYCPASQPCRRYEEIFKGSADFCDNVWDHSWKTVPDEKPCMRLWFNSTAGNPNRQVAEYRVDELLREWNGQSPLACSTLVVISALLVVTIWSS